MSSGARVSESRFQVLPGGRRAADTVAGVHIVVARAEDPPFSVDAEVFEEDTWLALSTKTNVISSPGHPLRVMTHVWEAEPEAPGSVAMKPGPPVRLLAVVHDLDAEPSWTAEWIEAAVTEVVRVCREHRLRAVKLPLLGSKHGDMPASRFMELLGGALRRAQEDAGSSLQRLWVVRESESGEELLQALGTSP